MALQMLLQRAILCQTKSQNTENRSVMDNLSNKHGLNVHQFFLKTLKKKEKIIQRIKEIPLSRNTVKVRILDMADNVSHQQSTDITSCDSLSICLDESTDVTGSARLAIFGRYLVGDTIKEELIS